MFSVHWYDLTSPTCLASHRAALAREELQLDVKEEQKNTHIVVMCFVYDL